MSLVLDGSVTLAWIYSAGATEEPSIVITRVIELRACIPGLWRLVVAEVL